MFDDDCVTVLYKALKLNCSVVCLALYSCSISSKTVLTIVEYYKCNSILHSVNLDENAFSNDD